MFMASLKHERGKGLGNKVTGAVTARTPDGSVPWSTNAGDGRTASPLAIDQSFRLVNK